MDLLLEIRDVALAKKHRVQRRVVVTILDVLGHKARNRHGLINSKECSTGNRQLFFAVRKRKAACVLGGIRNSGLSVELGEAVHPVLDERRHLCRVAKLLCNLAPELARVWLQAREFKRVRWLQCNVQEGEVRRNLDWILTVLNWKVQNV